MNIKYCPKCAKNGKTFKDPKEFFGGYMIYFFQDKIGKTCQLCDKDTLIETNITEDELFDIGEASNYNPDFLKAMRDLKEKDIIEYELKMAQFRKISNSNLPSNETQPTQSTQPQITCPYCKSTNTKKISSASRAGSILGFGIFSKKIGKEWHCNNCNSDF